MADAVIANANMSREQGIELFQKVTEKTVDEQAVYFLNALWSVPLKDGATGEAVAEQVWDWCVLFKSILDENENIEEGDEKTELNEVNSRLMLEKLGQTLTAIKFRQTFKEIDIDENKTMAFAEFLLFKLCDATTESIVTLVKRPQATSPQMEAAKQAILDVKAALDAIDAQRQALEDEASGTGVKAMAAKNKLAQFEQEDHQEVKMAEAKAERALQKAQKTVEAAPGGLWWINKGVEEASKYKPKRNLKKA